MRTKYKITTRKTCDNPEAYAAFVWIGREPHCLGDSYETRKAAKTAAKQYVLECCIDDISDARQKVERLLAVEVGKTCTRRFSLCLDCEHHNGCQRYARHFEMT